MIDIEFSTIAFTIINLIVLFLLLKKFLIGPLNDVIKKREDMIAGTISDANNQKAEAMKLKSQYEDTLAGLMLSAGISVRNPVWRPRMSTAVS